MWRASSLGLFDWCSLDKIKLLTTAMSMRWKHDVFHHLRHNITFSHDLVRPINGIHVPVIIRCSWHTTFVLQTREAFDFLLTWTLSLALSIVVSKDATLLSIHCSAKQWNRGHPVPYTFLPYPSPWPMTCYSWEQLKSFYWSLLCYLWQGLPE